MEDWGILWKSTFDDRVEIDFGWLDYVRLVATMTTMLQAGEVSGPVHFWLIPSH